MKVKTIIVDDEPHAREGIRIRLHEFLGIEIIGESASGTDAVDMISELQPDLLFLDIQMPEMNGFEVLKNISVEPKPQVIFVTAYDKYAIKAFEYHALDYLLKPVDDIRFRDAVIHVLNELNRRNLELYSGKLRTLIDDYFNSVSGSNNNTNIKSGVKSRGFISRLMIKSKDEISIVNIEEIDWLESAGDYVYVHANSKKHILRETLTALEQKLNPNRFVRIHRSSIVNLDKIKNLKANEHGDFEVFLHNGEKLKLSRTFKLQFQKIIENPESGFRL